MPTMGIHLEVYLKIPRFFMRKFSRNFAIFWKISENFLEIHKINPRQHFYIEFMCDNPEIIIKPLFRHTDVLHGYTPGGLS